MARHKSPDTENITTGIDTIGLRLTPTERTALERLKALEQARYDELGVTARAGFGSVLRALIKREAQARGVWPGAAAPAPAAAAPTTKPAKQPELFPTEPKPVTAPKPVAVDTDPAHLHARLQKAKAKGYSMSDVDRAIKERHGISIRVRAFDAQPHGTLSTERRGWVAEWLTENGF